jgi:tripartite-type tricarboxylate transporter receptor subunit TctC
MNFGCWQLKFLAVASPKDIVDKINADVNDALRQPELQERLKNLSAEVFGGSVEKTSKCMHEEVDRWANVIKAANIEMQ